MRPGRPVVMVDGDTREIVRRYPSVKAAAESHGVPHGTMYIRCQRGAIRAGRPYFRFEDEFDPAEDARTPSRRLTPPTRREMTCLAFFRAYEQDEGFSPTIRECAAFMGVSHERVHQILKRLEAKGLVERRKHRDRKWRSKV